MSDNYKSNSFEAKEESEEDKLLREQSDKQTAAINLFNICETNWQDIRRKSLDDLEFYSGQQWDQALIAAGQVKKEPTLSVNRLPQFVKQIENEIKSREINITVSPSDEEGSEDIADIYNGLIRHIQDDSGASKHYVHAAGENGALVPGFGFLRVDIEPLHKNSWSDEKKLMVSSIFDPFSILPDLSAQQADFSDAEYWFEISDYNIDTYRNEFPHSHIASLDVASTGMKKTSWGANNNTDDVRVLRYWYKEVISIVEYKLADGSVVNSTTYEKPVTDKQEADSEMNGKLPFPKDEEGEDQIVSRKRMVFKTKIKWMDINNEEILREGEWPGTHFPFVAVIGPQTMINGRRDIRGIIRYAKDSQKMLNYMASSVARRIGSANKAPWIADKRSIAPYQKQWQTANTENWSVLMYDAYRDNPSAPGELIQNPVPQRADQTGQINDLLEASAHWSDELKATIGIYDAGLGATPNEQSGVAIKTLAQQGQNSNAHFSENLVTSIKQLGHILVDLIPLVYDTPRVIKVINPDSTEELIKINQIFTENGQTKKHDLAYGNYSVKINAGPAYATKKQAALEQILELTRVDPKLVPVLQDIMVGAMDFPGSKHVQERLVKLFAIQFPQLIDTQKGMPELPPQAQAEMMQAHQTIEMLTNELQTIQSEYEKLQMLIKTDTLKMQNQIKIDDNEARIFIEQERLRREADAKNNEAKMQLELLKGKIDHIEAMHKIMMPHFADEIKARATGGPVEEGKPYLVGEEGPEIIVPESDGEVKTHQSMMDIAKDYAKGKQTTKKGKRTPMEIADAQERGED